MAKSRFISRAALSLGFCAALLAGDAAACAAGARCLTAPETRAPEFKPGDVLTPGSFNVLLNALYYGLPETDDGSWYVTINRRVLRIDPGSYEVIEDVTLEANRAF